MNAPRIFAPEYYARMSALEAASWWNAAMRDIAARVLAHVPLSEQGTMLDVGCGSGQSLAWFRALHPKWNTLGIDVSPEGLAAARSAGERVLEASATDLPFATASFDLVLTYDVLQHLPLEGGDTRALLEIHRVLRPGGTLFIRTNAQSLPYTPDDATYNFHKYASGELRHKLRSSGFHIQRFGRVNALLGLAEIPRELRARRRSGSGYSGILSTVPPSGLSWKLKRAWLNLEGRLVAAGMSVPGGRTHLVLATARER